MKQTDKPEESEENLNAGAMHETQVLAVVTQECWAQQESLGCRRRFWRQSTAREYAGVRTNTSLETRRERLRLHCPWLGVACTIPVGAHRRMLIILNWRIIVEIK